MTPGKVFAAIPAIMAEVGAVEKARKNQAQNYMFRGIDDVYAAVQLVLAKHEVFVVPRVLDDVWTERQTRGGSTLFHVRTKIAHVFYASDGSNFEAVTIGEAMDSGDKAANKAMSTAMKYALVEVLCLPTSDPKDPEADSYEVVPDAPAAGPRPSPENGAFAAQTWRAEMLASIPVGQGAATAAMPFAAGWNRSISTVEAAPAQGLAPAELPADVLKRVQAAVTALDLGHGTDGLLKGKDRDYAVRTIRLNWIADVIKRKVSSTKELTQLEAELVISTAQGLLAKRQANSAA